MKAFQASSDDELRSLGGAAEMECPLPEAPVREEPTGSMESHKKFQDSEAPQCGYGERLNLEQAGRKSVCEV